MKNKPLITILFALHIIGTGLWRSIEAQAYKPNSLWFCIVTGLIMIISAHLLQSNRIKLFTITANSIALLIFGFYLYCFISNPSSDATSRVAAIILSSIAYLSWINLPQEK